MLTALSSPVAAQGPPFGVPPGQAKKMAAAETVASAAPAAARVPAAQAPRRATAPGHLKRAASAAMIAARPLATTTAPAPAPVAVATTPVPTATTAQVPTRATTAAPAKRSRRAHRKQARRPVPTGTATPQAKTAPARRAAAPKRVVARRAEPVQPVTRITRSITHTVRDIVEVVPGWAKALVAALGVLLLLAAGFIVQSTLRTRRLRRQRAQLLEDIGVLQEALLPTVPERVGSLAVSVAYRPAAGIAAGGDFYDVFPLDNGCAGIIVGDISGHGREALGPATFIRHMVRSYLEAGLTPRAALQLAGNILDDQERDDFATIVVGLHDPAAGTLSYATAGHPPPIVTGPGSYEPLTVACSPPAGIGVTTGLRQTTVGLPPGSTVCFFTDGLVEARVGRGWFGRERLEFAVEDLPADATASDLIDRVAHATQRLRDDVAVCLIRIDEGGSAGTVRVEEIEVTLSDLHSAWLRRFFDACAVRPADAADAIRRAGPHVAGYGSVLLRVRLAEMRSGVDVVPVATATTGADVIHVSR